jgi:galactokinase
MLKKLVKEISDKFKTIFDDVPLLVQSPARINLLGEHTDYNDGFVLPAAINRWIIFGISKRNDRQVKVHANDLNDKVQFNLADFNRFEMEWPDYLLGVLLELLNMDYQIGGFNCVFGGNIPVGAGLSSSAAIECGLLFALNELFHLGIDKFEIAKIAQRAENKYVGMRCGIMDQFINMFGRENYFVKLDCRSFEYEYYPFEVENVSILLCDSRVHHYLANSEYNKRRGECEEAGNILKLYVDGIQSLRDLTPESLIKFQRTLTPTLFKRCNFVVNENIRVGKACENLLNNDFIALGNNMFDTHTGLRNDYEVSCSELDLLVEMAAELPGVFGSRMMGGGFGGCAINLVQKNFLENFKSKINEKYYAHTGNKIKIYDVSIVGGTSLVLD